MPARFTQEMRRFARDLAGGSWRRALFRAALVAIVLGAGGVLYAWSGLVSVAASSGHSALVYRFLDFTKQSAARTQSMDVAVPPLDDPALLLKGAGHYATGCAPCHGAPGRNPSLIAQRMTPEPPFLPAKLDRWNAKELFWIVKHGIKFTGMPAWPALAREDEIWAMVAFLAKLPELDAKEYGQLAYGERRAIDIAADTTATAPNDLDALIDPIGSVLDNCARCHGADGMGRGKGAFPRLAGQNEAYLYDSLRAYAGGARASGIMQPVAADLDALTMRALARHYASLPVKRDGSAKEAPPRGRRIAQAGIPARGIPACRHCHGPVREARNPHYPELAGQYADYIELQLGLFHDGRRAGTPYAHIMNTVTRRMTPQDMRAVAQYYATLPAGD